MLRFVFGLACLLFATVACGDQPRPNILWLSCEDISPHIVCFGDEHAITPNIDQLALQGTRFTNTYTTAGVCAPCRSAIITGVYQTTLGTHHMRCKAELPDFVKPFPAYLVNPTSTSPELPIARSMCSRGRTMS